jgi:serine/threonine-protein kinase
VSSDSDAKTDGFSPTARFALLQAELAEGQPVGEYRVTGRIGSGGMGVVYAGVHPLLQRKVAIKVLSHTFANNDDMAARFLQEARAATLVHHHNIVDVFAFGQLPDGRYYQVMELLDGRSLADLLDHEAAPSVEAVRVIVGQLLEGLQAAHEKNIIHRDLKPENVFVHGKLDDPDALTVKILDFGLAKLVRPDDEKLVISRTGAPMGTPAYMSPEQCRATAPIDARSDLYAVGVVLFEMFAGYLPFRCESVMDTMSLQIYAPPPSLEQRIGMPAVLDHVILKALAKKAEDRFATAADMRAALDVASFEASGWQVPRGKFAAPEPQPSTESANTLPLPEARPTPTAETRGSQTGEAAEVEVPRRPWVLAVVLSALLAIGGVAAFRWAGSRPLPPPPAAKPKPPEVGTVRVEVTPSARVLLDQKLVGVGESVSAPGVDAGLHQLHVEADGHQPYDKLFTIGNGETLTLAITLQPIKKKKN